ncbi:anti-sigma factor [Nocardioides donggukensis]|uniref:Zf-HC2 domain-containing protein n=1 Tax=Nocardioides donggukensis TaxID=2774019 RepID=A0A927K1E6_9ACTN|nr:zf-HC2 domain-containing protein [Nocardioides donggukensis]MBD8868254.1 zf-HC2 domain-containing protein [Nocardioides donggukensis]
MSVPMLDCWLSARRLDRYLDRDDSARLTDGQARRLEHHLSVCARCASSAEDRMRVRAALHRLGARHRPDPAAVARLEDVAARLRTGEGA